MEFVSSRDYFISIRFPWGELLRFKAGVLVEADRTLVFLPPQPGSYEPCLDHILCETESYVMGWLKGTCDTTVVVSQDESAPLP